METTILFNKSMKNTGKTFIFGYSTISLVTERKVSRSREIKV